MIGRVLGHWHLLEEIGSGGMGVVYRAHDEHLGRDVAVKVLSSGLVVDDVARKRFRLEARLVSRLHHPNIQVVHDFDTQEGIDFLVTEYIPGESLDFRIVRGPLEEKELIHLGIQLVHGLQAAHDKGLIHRDLKPANLRVTPQGQLKILDFGLAKLLEAQPGVDAPLTTTLELLTQEGRVAGTLPYMSPEQLRGEPLDARTDLYSAGVVLYELATGKRPFTGENQPILINAILSQAPTPPSQVHRKVSDRLEQVILKALEKDRDLRYQTARDLAIDLERLAAPSMSVASPRRPIRRRPLLAAGGVLVGGALMTLFLLCRPQQGEALDSIAVLPFENVGGNPELEYLSDGIAESLTNTLSRLPSLKKVIAWGSIRQLRNESGGKALNPVTAGEQLGVKAVLLGQLNSRETFLVVKAELMEIKGTKHIWGDQYQGTLDDVFAMEVQLANKITSGLRIHLNHLPDVPPLPGRSDAPDPEAYQLYLKGRYHLYKWSKDEVLAAIDLFQRSIQSDPGFALPYCGLAEAYLGLNNIWAPPREIMPKVRNAVLHALEIDSTLAEARLSLANVKMLFDWDWKGAEEDYRKGVALNPGLAQAQLCLGYYLVLTGHFSEAEPFLTKARELDPFQDIARGFAIYPAFYSRDYTDAIDQLRDWVKTNPHSPFPYQLLGEAYELNGQLDQALVEIETSLSKGPYPWTIAAKARVLAKLSRAKEARAILADLEARASSEYVTPYALATVYGELGEVDMAFVLLNRALSEKSEDVIFLKIDPRIDNLRGDPRFSDLLRRVGLPA